MKAARRTFWRGASVRSGELPVEQWQGPPGDQPRVLLECPSHASPSIVAAALRQEGFEVAVCEGPHGKSTCALVRDGSCTLVDGADVVVNLFGIPEQRYVDILEGVKRTGAGTPIVVEVPGPEAREHEGTLRGCRVTHPPLGSDALVGHIWAALEEVQGDTEER
jgi:hypothetical protein